jgi:hypothetical protein
MYNVFLFGTTKSNCMAEKPAWFYRPQTKPPVLLSAFHPNVLRGWKLKRNYAFGMGKILSRVKMFI